MSDAISIKISIVAAALGTMTSVAWAQPMKLTNAQMDQVAAGIAIWTEDPIRVSRMPFRGKPTDMVAIATRRTILTILDNIESYLELGSGGSCVT